MLMLRHCPRSRNIIQLLEWFDEPQRFVLILDYCHPCQCLIGYIGYRVRLSEMTACGLMRQAILAAQHRIDSGVFHNDIHSYNFLVNDYSLELKLIDFGCGQIFNSDGYRSSQYRGAPDFCPPEVMTEPNFHAVLTNVWSFGVVLYEMLNRCLPFDQPEEILHGKIKFQNPYLSRACHDLIGWCFTRDPTKRPTLEQLLQHEWFRNPQM
ncbi:serine/threonine-protein kinase pim-3-like [Myxocyprinus asiaticus]|uniref:serine/threonine-protein kinase pim-3-like n=1 Tax=Myxocyprinus asiaticus TaxID=70543 RepID=UPI0022229BB9|nr:serine/threonine-protein kinase pim-3-like [Myxocyprinus asiaticus]